MKVSVCMLLTSLDFIILLAFNSMFICSTTSNVNDMQTLLLFKSSIYDPKGALVSWNHSLHFCQWSGVTCGKKQRADRVEALELLSSGLSGEIPPVLANLSFLQVLELDDNKFGGRIPEELGNLSQLRVLGLSSNYLHGNIPATLTACSDLQIIELDQNNLMGEIPRDIGMLSKMLLINFGTNSLTGSLPTSLGNLSSLQNLFVYENYLSGSIPESIGRLSNLQLLNLRENKLSGSIPSSFYNLSSMKQVSFAGNLLEGTLPPNLFDVLPNLTLFYVYRNRLHGPIPASLTNASNMVDLQMRLNSFRGTIPSNLGNLRSLQKMHLGENQLEASKPSDWKFLASLSNCSFLKTLVLDVNKLFGPIPTFVGNLSSSMMVLAMCSNKLSGSIPAEIGNLRNLTTIDLSDNSLTGTIPASIGLLRNLNMLNLSGNSLTGRIPYSIGNLSQILRLYLHRNNLSESIPESIGDCKSLLELDLSQNMLAGLIPGRLFSLSSLATYLNLSNNFLHGPLPREVGNLKNVGGIAVSDNKLSGEIPNTLAQCQSLEYLYLQGNFFQGTIPYLFELKGLRELDLSRNNLTGGVPKFLQNLSALQYLNLSFNNLEGELPSSGIFRNITEASIYGNSKLCGGNPRLHLHPCKAHSIKHTSVLLKVLIPILSLVLCMLMCFILFIICLKSKKLRKRSTDENTFRDQFARVSYSDLLRATDDFSVTNLVGVGSFGCVYKGIMDNCAVAIKVINLQQHGASKSFITECEVLRRIRHRNLVKIITSCSTIDNEGNDFKALVLEYMPNGCLDNWLHQSACKILPKRNFTLIQRINIAIDVASALDYLHHDAILPIIHCDLKPSNVLLDEEMHAHLGDFGLARLVYDKTLEADECVTGSLIIKGTIGYVAPEYGMGGQISIEGDIYSYGIILLELLTGRRPTDDMFKDGLSLHTYVRMTSAEKILDIVYPNCLSTEDVIEGSFELQKCIATIFNIGLECSNEDPRERMQISDAIKGLCAVRQTLLALL